MGSIEWEWYNTGISKYWKKKKKKKNIEVAKTDSKL